jgi:hypothetical protein
MLCHVAFVRTNVSEEHIASIIRVTRFGKLGTTLAVTSSGSMLQLLVTANVLSVPILVTLMMEVIRSSESWAVTRATRHNIPEDAILEVYVAAVSVIMIL